MACRKSYGLRNVKFWFVHTVWKNKNYYFTFGFKPDDTYIFTTKNFKRVVYTEWAGVAQLVYRLGTGWTVRGSNHGWGRDFPHLSRPALGSTQTTVQWVLSFFPGVKSGRGVTLTPHHLLVPLVMKE
jgi:hypothetical protein